MQSLEHQVGREKYPWLGEGQPHVCQYILLDMKINIIANVCMGACMFSCMCYVSVCAFIYKYFIALSTLTEGLGTMAIQKQ